MAAVARAAPHRGVKDDEMVAHRACGGEASPGVIWNGQPVEGVLRSVATPLHLTSGLSSFDRPTPAGDRDVSTAGDHGSTERDVGVSRNRSVRIAPSGVGSSPKRTSTSASSRTGSGT